MIFKQKLEEDEPKNRYILKHLLPSVLFGILMISCTQWICLGELNISCFASAFPHRAIDASFRFFLISNFPLRLKHQVSINDVFPSVVAH